MYGGEKTEAPEQEMRDTTVVRVVYRGYCQHVVYVHLHLHVHVYSLGSHTLTHASVRVWD